MEVVTPTRPRFVRAVAVVWLVSARWRAWPVSGVSAFRAFRAVWIRLARTLAPLRAVSLAADPVATGMVV